MSGAEKKHFNNCYRSKRKHIATANISFDNDSQNNKN